jgi:uncharacterized DUF497 family protein
MEIEFDPAKSESNLRKHGISLADAELMNINEATVEPDTRFDYGEQRFRAWGLIAGVLHILAFTIRGSKIRAISLRKSNAMENRRYEKNQEKSE